MTGGEADSIRILHVDDDADPVHLAAAFRDHDHDRFSVQAAIDATHALEQITTDDTEIDCLVSAYEIAGGMDGIELLEAVRETRPDLPFIMFPLKGTEEIASTAITAGVTDYLRKTDDSEQYDKLAHRIVSAVQAQKTEDELEASQARFRALAEGLTHAIIAIDSDSTIRFVNHAVESIFGYTADELREESLTRIMPKRLHQTHRKGLQRYIETGNRQLDWSSTEFPGQHKNGHEIPLEITFCDYEHEDQDLYIGIIRDITEREQYNQRLETLHDATRRLMQAETHDDICETAFMTARDVLDLPLTGIWLYNEETEHLEPIAVPRHVEDVVGDPPTYTEGSSLSWEVFSDGKTRWYDDVTTETEAHNQGTPIRSEIILPLGDHGVINHGSMTTGEFTQTDVYFAEILAAATEAALDRADRERELTEQRDEIATLNQINILIQELIRDLPETTSQEEIERTVCRHLVSSDLYGAVWIGDVHESNNELIPHEWGGIDDDTLRRLMPPAGEDGIDADRAPGRRAIHTGEVCVIEDVSEDPSFEPWRETAIDEEYGSVMGVPLTYGSTIYGVLVIYATQHHAFDDRARTAFEILGGTVGFTINAVKSKQLLLTDSVIELEVRVADSAAVFPILSEEFDCRSTLDGLIPGADDTLLHYIRMESVPSENVLDWVGDLPSVESVRLVGEEVGRECRFEVAMSSSVCKTLIEAGATIQSASATDGEFQLTIDVVDEAAVRSTIETLQAAYTEVDLVSKRDVERSPETDWGFQQQVTDRLTERQQTVLLAAYAAGYYDWPRGSTAEEVAESIGVTPPTLHNHLRKGQHKLLTELFGDRVQS